MIDSKGIQDCLNTGSLPSRFSRGRQPTKVRRLTFQCPSVTANKKQRLNTTTHKETTSQKKLSKAVDNDKTIQDNRRQVKQNFTAYE